MNIAFVRGQYINNFELQSYYPMLKKHKDVQITGFSSLKPKHKINIPTIKLPSPVDLPSFPKKLPILNRMVCGDAMYLWGLENKLKGFDIVHVRETYFHFSSQAVYAKRLGKIPKILVTCSETIPFNHETIWGRKRLKQNVLQEANHFHCLTQKAKDCLIKEGVIDKKITVIPYGVDLDEFKPLSNPKNRKHVKGLFIGRLEDQKGVSELVLAYKKINLEFPDFELRVVGQGPDAHKFQNLGIEPEFYPYSIMPQIMNDTDFLILPSKATTYWEEYLGMVLLEAMACGLPVLTTNCGAIPEVVSNAALVVEQGKENELYKGMKEMILNKILRLELRDKGLRRVKANFDARKQGEKLYEMYRKLV